MLTQSEITKLQEAIALAKGGRTDEARFMFLELTGANPKNEVAWIWLGQLSDTANVKISYFKKALSINPDRELVRVALRDLLMEEGISCGKSGFKVQAHQHFSEVVFLDPTCEAAWLWLATVETDQQETIRYLENVVALNAQNTRAKDWLNRLRPPTREMPVLPETPEPVPDRPAGESDGRTFEMSGLLQSPPKPPESPAPPVAPVRESGTSAGPVARAAIEEAIAAENARSGEFSLSPDRFRQKKEAAEVERAAAPTAIRGLVLTVDDSAIIRRAISSTLQKEGYQVIEAEDGMNALTILNDCLPDVILLDIAMPMMDGYEVCRLIRKNQTLKSIPVVMLSGKDGFFDKVKGKIAGSTQYLTKPFDPGTLLATVEKYRRPDTAPEPNQTKKSIWGTA